MTWDTAISAMLSTDVILADTNEIRFVLPTMRADHPDIGTVFAGQSYDIEISNLTFDSDAYFAVVIAEAGPDSGPVFYVHRPLKGEENACLVEKNDVESVGIRFPPKDIDADGAAHRVYVLFSQSPINVGVLTELFDGKIASDHPSAKGVAAEIALVLARPFRVKGE